MKPLIVIFGITGDLSRRKLIPALSAIAESGTVDEFEVLGISRRELEIGELVGETLAPRTSSMTMDLSDAQAYEQLAKRCEINNDRSVIFYLSVPPLAVEPITRSLACAGFSRPNVKLLLEKPFGIDEVSAREMATLLSESFDETQLYRIDHYLAKEMAQNIIAFRAGNAMFAHMWNHDIIDRVEIDAIEKIDIEGRGEFYEQTGAMRDVMQGHLMQLLSLVLCDLPEDLTWPSMPRLRARALSKIAPVLPQESVRAQYEGYDEEVKNPGSRTETFVSVELHSDDPRWQGVELRLTTGKSLDEKTTEVRLYTKPTLTGDANMLRFRIQPDESVELTVYSKKPGYLREFELRSLDFSYPENERLPDAYEQVLVDAMRSDKSSFASTDEIMQSWRILQPLLEAWSMETTPLLTYKKSSSIDDVLSGE